MRVKKFFQNFWTVLKGSFNAFINDNAMKLSASLSYYTVFSLAPLLIVVISLLGVFYGREAIQGRIYGQIDSVIGKSAALQIQEIIKNVQISGDSHMGAIIGIATLIFSATGVFIEIQDSINSVWSIKAKPKQGWFKFIQNRLLSFSLIITLGFLLLVSLIVSAFLDILSQQLERLFSDYTLYIAYALNYILIICVITALFAIIFKVLPDGNPRWKDTLIGAAFTAVLFTLGKFLISFYLGQSDVGSTYGAAGSIIVILLWVYYSSIILYFGAEFTKVYSQCFGTPIEPSKHAVFIVKEETEHSANEMKTINHENKKSSLLAEK
ncbi:YihY/virulence factor BrkB family protein [Cytophagaceae bacterium YF14B1]|uniref:YihY/virulence factor BrkB family protein n=1 Tax=Xanthocytophaga flava TaxID=3048013 RepID=A0AAE3QNR0_9BACT|nr:YihY/virulence factor BrkB family protein [Xanthocytophaga flavus]MDJ1482061.1 YihY/virulence factor BrkB family protein [Xanthocytophaga flavus]